MNTADVQRDHLLTAAVGRRVDRIEAHRVRLGPGQRADPHAHAGGVVGYVTEGRIIYQRCGEAAQELRAGSAFYEPPGAAVSRFDNLSDTEPATFVAYYLLTGDQPLITFIEQEPQQPGEFA